LATPPAGLSERVLELYQQLADATSRADASERQARDQVEAQTRALHRTIALLAAERFEYDRLLRRLLPELEKVGHEHIGRLLALHTRSWDATLRRVQIEVRDLTGEVLTDALADMVEVESAIPDPAVQESTVRETLFPLVLHAGRVVGLAKVVTSVPLQQSDIKQEQAL
jgi:hypothetical protein